MVSRRIIQASLKLTFISGLTPGPLLGSFLFATAGFALTFNRGFDLRWGARSKWGNSKLGGSQVACGWSPSNAPSNGAAGGVFSVFAEVGSIPSFFLAFVNRKCLAACFRTFSGSVTIAVQLQSSGGIILLMCW